MHFFECVEISDMKRLTVIVVTRRLQNRVLFLGVFLNNFFPLDNIRRGKESAFYNGKLLHVPLVCKVVVMGICLVIFIVQIHIITLEVHFFPQETSALT